MVLNCAAHDCKNSFKNKPPGCTFHRFPKNNERRLSWEKAVRRSGWKATNNHFLCSQHFEDHMFDRTGQTVRLRNGAIPTIFSSSFPKNFKPKPNKYGRKRLRVSTNLQDKNEKPDDVSTDVKAKKCDAEEPCADKSRNNNNQQKNFKPKTRKYGRKRLRVSTNLQDKNEKPDDLSTDIKPKKCDAEEPCVDKSSNHDNQQDVTLLVPLENFIPIITQNNADHLEHTTDVNTKQSDAEELCVDKTSKNGNQDDVTLLVSLENCIPIIPQNNSHLEPNKSAKLGHPNKLTNPYILREISEDLRLHCLPNSWASYLNENELGFLKVKNDTVLMTLKFDRSLSFTLKVNGEELPSNHELHNELLAQRVTNCNDIICMLSFVNLRWTICEGMNGKNYVDYFFRHPSINDCRFVPQTSALYSQQCQLVVPVNGNRKLCCDCSLLKRQLGTNVRKSSSGKPEIFSYECTIEWDLMEDDKKK